MERKKMNKELAISILRGDVLGTNEQTHEAVFMAIKALKAEPVRHGKWMYKEYKMSNGQNFGYYVCSECNHATWNHKDYHYCFNCGAKMEDEE